MCTIIITVSNRFLV